MLSEQLHSTHLGQVEAHADGDRLHGDLWCRIVRTRLAGIPNLNPREVPSVLNAQARDPGSLLAVNEWPEGGFTLTASGQTQRQVHLARLRFKTRRKEPLNHFHTGSSSLPSHSGEGKGAEVVCLVQCQLPQVRQLRNTQKQTRLCRRVRGDRSPLERAPLE